MVQGSDFEDVLRDGGMPAVLAGGRGNDRYLVSHPDTQIVEQENEGIDEVRTTVSFTLPPHVENLYAEGTGEGIAFLIGNALANHIVGAPFSYETIEGRDGDDVLDGGGRHGGLLDGGNGNDRLITSFGQLRGGAGADTFVAGGRGAHTSPDVAITVLDFNAAEGDRLEVAHVHSTETPQALYERGALRFDAATSTLTLDLDPSTTTTGSVDQVFVLPVVDRFNPAWLRITGPATP